MTQIPTWELRSSSRCSRWLWLEFTTLSATETQPNASWLRFPARRTPPYSAEQHPHVPHCTLSSQEHSFAAARSRNPDKTGQQQDLGADTQLLQGTEQAGVEMRVPWDRGNSQTRQEHPNPALEEEKKLIHCSGGLGSTMLG